MTGGDSVPVAKSIARSIVVGVSVVAHGPVAAHDDGGASFVEASTVEAAVMEAATASTMEATALEISVLSRS